MKNITLYLRQWICISNSRELISCTAAQFFHDFNNVKHNLDIHESVHRDTTMKVTDKMQLYRLICYSKSALHVSGDVFTHHQEYLTVFTVSGSIHPSSFNSSKTPASSYLGEHYQILWIQSSAPNGGRKHRPKHVELTRNNKLTCIVASCWLLS